MALSACPAHPGATAVASCSACFVALCEACRSFDGMRAVCHACHRRLRRAPLVRGAVTLAALAAVGAGAYWAYQSYKPRYDYGALTGELGKLEATLAQEPCDRQKAQELLKGMLSAGDSRGVIDRAAAFWAKCGDYAPMREQTQAAHRRLGELDRAAEDLTVLVERSPQMPYYWAWRAAVYEEKGDFDRAAEDLRRALALYPAAVDIPQRLADIYERQGKACDAVALLQGLAFRYQGEPFVAGVRARVEGLEQKGVCGVAAGAGDRVSLRVHPGHSTAVAKARLNDRQDASLVVDTGASYVTITRSLSDRLGVDLSTAAKGKIVTANGTREALLVTMPSVAVGGLRAERVPTVVVDDLQGIDGLLGMSFLSRFDMRQSGGVVELSARKGRPSPVASVAAP